MNEEALAIYKKAIAFSLDDPEGSSIDDALVSIVEYLHDELVEPDDDDEIEFDQVYPVLSSFMKAIYTP